MFYKYLGANILGGQYLRRDRQVGRSFVSPTIGDEFDSKEFEWLGAIMGMFFGEKSMSVLEDQRHDYAKNMNSTIAEYLNFLEKTIPTLKKK